MLNRVELIGTMTRDPELEHTARGAAYCKLQLAVNGTRFNPEAGEHEITATFISVVFWGYQATELIEADVHKGEELYVLGSMDQSEFEKRDGTKDTRTRVLGQVWHLTRRKARASGRPGSPF